MPIQSSSLEDTALELKSKSSRGIRNNPEIENFYRFVQENDLRSEAKLAIFNIVEFMKPAKKKRRKKRSKKIQ